MTAAESIRDAIQQTKAEVDRYGWEPSSTAWNRAFGQMSGLNWALSIVENASAVPSTHETGGA